MTQLTDSFNRKMDYLRISVTDRCNFRCQYCMPEDIQFQDKSHILTLEEMLTFAEACLELGVSKDRETSSEPHDKRRNEKNNGWLKDLGFEDVTMTTNGFILEENQGGDEEKNESRQKKKKKKKKEERKKTQDNTKKKKNKPFLRQVEVEPAACFTNM